MMMQPDNDRMRKRATVAALVVVCVLLLVALAMAGNVWRQWQHCGTPLARCASAQVVPCERVDVVQAELNALINRFKAQNGVQ